tara:strand:+ start:7932 stop:8633 length:702 start_codon:yes stop_codon:yes gene_type:complete
METKDKIERRMIDRGINQADLVRITGASKGAVNHWTSGVSKPGNKYLTSLCKALDCNPEWLLDDNSPYVGQVKETNATYTGSFSTWDNGTELNSDEVELPFFTEVQAAAGNGHSLIQENHGPKLRFSRSTLSRYSIEPENAACIKVKGNSMEPVLPDGSTIGVDLAQKIIVDGKMYALDHDGMLRVKMLYRLPGGGIRLRSYNHEEHPDERYSQEEAKHIRIIGRVFWSSVMH